jgi:hypothetical protein
MQIKMPKKLSQPIFSKLENTSPYINRLSVKNVKKISDENGKNSIAIGFQLQNKLFETLL